MFKLQVIRTRNGGFILEWGDNSELEVYTDIELLIQRLDALLQEGK